ncbi:MAG: SDR family oxidoreductase [Solirubrobacterales bacterium]|nr:SDR family oxidoreductase [Solirubrobacterales bacterium]MBV9715559.1 SDR family oxidoreductase [Solirubrobacterales bacterium]
MPDWLGLAGQRVLVAGGGGTLGSGLVTGFLEAGAEVGVLDLSTANVNPAVRARCEADLSDAAAARGALSEVRAQLGGLDVFVHCVGINNRKPVEKYGADEWDAIVGVNLTSAFHTAVEAAVGMREQRRGRIVFFSSVAGRSGHKLHGPYAATKGALNQLMRVIAHEYAEFGVTANAVAPGYMDTELTRQYLAENPDKRQALIELIPAGRFGALEEVVAPVLFLCSPHASFITGQVLYIDGGRTIV